MIGGFGLMARPTVRAAAAPAQPASAALEMVDIDLASLAGAALRDRVAARAGEALARAAALVSQVFLLRSPWAPGFHFVGAQLDPARQVVPATFGGVLSLSGPGETVEDAMISCLGEGIERLSQIERPGDVTRRAPPADVASQLLPASRSAIQKALRCGGLPRAADIDWRSARAIGDDGAILLPVDWCLRRSTSARLADPEAALSSGTAAGPSFAAAAERALLELVERDAAAAWWVGGKRPRHLPIEHIVAATALVGRLRGEARARMTWLLDISSDLGIPVVAAASVGSDGRGFACGLAARTSWAAAARAAVLELCQMELGLLLARAKLEQGVAPTAVDRRHLDRAARIDVARCALLHPVGPPSLAAAATGEDDGFGHVSACLARAGVSAALVDLTRADLGVSVVHAFAPELQRFPARRRTARLRRVVAEAGGARQWTHGAPLL